MTVVAVAALFYVSFWLIARLDQRRWMEFMRSRISVATSGGSAAALFGLGFTSIYREGVETSLFYQALLSFGQGLETWIAAGTAVAAGTLVVVAFLVFRSGRRIPVKQVLGVAVVLLMVLSVAFVGNGIRAFQEIGVVSLTVLHGVPSLPFFLAELLGWHPTLETIAGQLLLATIYILGAIWTFGIARRRIGGASSRPATRASA
jgi:high-affinity iron transporter